MWSTPQAIHTHTHTHKQPVSVNLVVVNLLSRSVNIGIKVFICNLIKKCKDTGVTFF